MKHEARKKRKEKVVRIWQQHYPNITVAEVSRVTGWSYRTIYRYLQEADQPLPPKKPTRTIDMEKVKQAHELYAVYGKKTEVARLMKMSRWQIDKYLKMSL